MDKYSTYTDAQLVPLLALDDELAFTELYHRYWKQLFHKTAQKLQNIQEAEEIVQEIFLDLWRRRNDLGHVNEFAAYTGTAIKYKIINSQAAAHRRAQFNMEQQEPVTQDDPIAQKELQQRLDMLITKLPQKCRLVYTLKSEGYTQKEIAHELNISENTVETHMKRALHHMRTGISNFIALLFFIFP